MLLTSSLFFFFLFLRSVFVTPQHQLLLTYMTVRIGSICLGRWSYIICERRKAKDDFEWIFIASSESGSEFSSENIVKPDRITSGWFAFLLVIEVGVKASRYINKSARRLFDVGFGTKKLRSRLFCSQLKVFYCDVKITRAFTKDLPPLRGHLLVCICTLTHLW